VATKERIVMVPRVLAVHMCAGHMVDVVRRGRGNRSIARYSHLHPRPTITLFGGCGSQLSFLNVMVLWHSAELPHIDRTWKEHPALKRPRTTNTKVSVDFLPALLPVFSLVHASKTHLNPTTASEHACSRALRRSQPEYTKSEHISTWANQGTGDYNHRGLQNQN
jgi:hypothetical protein